MKVKKVSKAFVFLFCGLVMCSCAKKKKQISIGSKNFTEQIILGELMAIMIEHHTDINVDRKLNLGGTLICFNSLNKGDIDLYAEYTGTGLTAILQKKAINDKDRVYKIVKEDFKKKYNLIWLEPFGFNNTYTLTMREKQAKELNITKISDLSRYRDSLVAGFTAEFMERPDGYPGLINCYGFEFKNKPKDLDPGLMYKAVAEEVIDIICGFATDGRISAFNLKVLEDDQKFFPPYYAAPVVRKKSLEKFPEIKTVLNKLAYKIDDRDMAELNYQVDKYMKKPNVVARDFLKSQGLIK